MLFRSSAAWTSSFQAIQQASDNAKAGMILAQQKIADAVVAAAARADAAWVKASQDMSLYNLLAASGWTGPKIAQYIGGGYSQQPGPRPGGGTGYQHGGPVSNTGLAMLHAGEFVLSTAMLKSLRLPSMSMSSVPALSSGGSPVINVYVQSPDINLDGYRLAGGLMKHIVSQIRLHTGITNM